VLSNTHASPSPPVKAAPPPTADPPRPAAARPGHEADERAAIIAALDACAGNQTRAAKRLGIARSTLATKLAIYRIPRPRSR
jgi:DNA-binding NtrC family response regulator